MLRNNLNIAIRILARHKGYTVINVAGLAVGMAACILILLYVQDELSFDKYHQSVERLYRVTLRGRLAGKSVHTSNTCPPLAGALLEEFPEVDQVSRLDGQRSSVLVTTGDGRFFNENRVVRADSTFFDLFSLQVLNGDARTALNRPNTIVITSSTAHKYFGDENPLGKTLTLDTETDFVVTAVTEDTPSNTHFQFDLLPSLVTYDSSRRPVWLNNFLYTYLRLKDSVAAETFEPKLRELVRKHVAPEIERAMGASLEEFFENGGEYGYFLQPVASIHFDTGVEHNILPATNPTYVALFGLIAGFILVLACINFMNLTTARSASRAKEVGIRKVIGSRKGQLIGQFLSESSVLSFAALALSLILVYLALPQFSLLAGKEIDLSFFADPYFIIALLGLTVFVGFLAGIYPAFFLSAFQPVVVMKGSLSRSSKGALVRSGLVVFQFGISIVLLVGTFVVGKQLEYIRQKELGFEKEHVMIIKRANALEQGLESFRTELQQIPSVYAVAGSIHLPGSIHNQNLYQPEGTASEQGYILNAFTIGYDFIETLGMELAEGRAFSKDFPTDSAAYVLNEAALRKFGWNEAVGKTIREPDPGGSVSGPVIGVVKDFHFSSLHHAIEPAILRLNSNALFVVVRLSGRDLSNSQQQIERVWQAHAPNQPFEFTFLDDEFDVLYRQDQRIGKLFATFSGLGVIIACLGLFGLASFAAEQRTKEIGVRKVLGASVLNVVFLLSKEFTRLVLLAFAIAVPVSYYFMTDWLQGFAYRTSIGVEIFAYTGVLVLAVALLTVSYQATDAALANPARALKYE
jgi:putative ABC transport system permease protein